VIIGTGLVSVLVFIYAFRLSGIPRVSRETLVVIQDTLAIIRDKNLSDEAREKGVQAASLKLFRAFFFITFRTILILGISFLPIYFAHLLGFVRIDDVTRFMSRWDVIALVSVVIILNYFLFGKTKPNFSAASQSNYSTLDRFFHQIVFAAPKMQLTVADIEKTVLRRVYRDIEADRPIFITSLPRAGTTILLEALYRFPSLATHLYRDMPFVLAPLFWSKLSGSFRKSAELVGRAHGDGLQIGYDSPEAFEEIMWRTFWPEKYNKDCISLWGPEDDKEEAREFFYEHFRKIIALRLGDRKRDGRYMSKNNANIARLDLICKMFNHAKIIVPVRNPIEHAASLLRQHLHFARMHRTDPFTRQYMEDIGHYEFGDLRRPIAFPGYESFLSEKDPLTIDYWLAYWISAFEYVFARLEKVILISYEHICMDAKRTLANLCEQLDIPTEDSLEEAASLFREPSPPKGDKLSCDPRLFDEAIDLYKSIIQ
jgi:hypothetical protein